VKVPRPPHPKKRRVPLPWQHPKPSREDARAPRRLSAILASPSYQEADRDIRFLREDDSRGLRLELEYTKAETLLRRHGIAHTILVLGSTRIKERRAARRGLQELKKKGTKERIAVAERIVAKSRYYDIAREFGRLVGRAGMRAGKPRAAIVTGGGPGIMEAANRGAFDVGAPSIGLNITLPQEQFPNPYVTPELCMRFRYFALRKLHFLLRARALVAFPGGFGTFDELFETLTLVQTRKIKPLPIVLVGREYWEKAFDARFLVDEGTIDPEDRELFWFAESAQEAWRGIERWYRLAGEKVFPAPNGAGRARAGKARPRRKSRRAASYRHRSA
jgi:uncharacterized protein (TIGR00730 family)